MRKLYVLLTKRAKYVRITPSFYGRELPTDFEGGCDRNYIQRHGIFSMITHWEMDLTAEYKVC